MGRATEAALDKLHAQVIEVITKGLGEDNPSPQLIAQAIKVLRDNGIDTPAKSARVSNLEMALADLDYEALGSGLPS